MQEQNEYEKLIKVKNFSKPQHQVEKQNVEYPIKKKTLNPNNNQRGLVYLRITSTDQRSETSSQNLFSYQWSIQKQLDMVKIADEEQRGDSNILEQPW